MKKILVIDNYDSFTYNLVHLLKAITTDEIVVKRNDEIALEAVANYDAIVLSPGPGLPAEAGIMPAILKKYGATKSIFGVCLGMQAIGECFGASLKNLSRVFHGVQTPMKIATDSAKIFENIPEIFEAGRYHSWVIDNTTLPSDSLEVTCIDETGEIMAVRHKEYNIRGVQFHPESVMTEHGEQMMKNYLKHFV